MCCRNVAAYFSAFRLPLLPAVTCRVNNKLLINVIWALALLPDPAKTLKTPAASSSRARCVGVLGAAVLNRISRYTAEEVFHVGAGLAMLGFKPPRTLQADSPREGFSRAAATTVGALIEQRSIQVMHYLSPKAIADAGFVAARLVAPGDMSAEWLKLFAHVSIDRTTLCCCPERSMQTLLRIYECRALWASRAISWLSQQQPVSSRTEN